MAVEKQCERISSMQQRQSSESIVVGAYSRFFQHSSSSQQNYSGIGLTNMSGALTRRWTPLIPHEVQLELIRSTARFKVVPAGRRSGKSERAKRFLVREALRSVYGKYEDPRFFAAAPTYGQARSIYWDDLKKLSPHNMIKSISESHLSIKYINGAEIKVVGMDKPERIEGSPWDGGILDEYANMKARAWGENVRPALSDRTGWCWLIGVPEGRNHYYDLYKRALEDDTGEWKTFTWPSSDILPPSEIESARRDLDELTFQQEYEASFVNFQGRAYYPFDERLHTDHVAHLYNPRAPLILMFDFNIAPGVAAIAQELTLSDGREMTVFIGEVHIPRNSNTPAVCRRIIKDWGEHRGRVVAYGDSTGGSGGSAKVQGSDWSLIKDILGSHFRDRFFLKIKGRNPSPRSRINAVNSRLLSVDGTMHAMIDVRCRNIIRDFEGVSLLEGGSGEIDKRKTPELTHLTDAIGYYMEYEYPVERREVYETKLTGF